MNYANMLNPAEQLEILKRGAAEIISEDEFRAKVEKSFASRTPLRVKLGIDPTAPDIHLGHSVVLRKLRQFQQCGHRVILLIGDFTALIGDPTGRSETRKVLSAAEIAANTKTYLAQVGKIVDTASPDLFELRYNSEWLSKLTFQQVLELSHHFTVARMLEREDFSNRYKSGKAIGLHEFFYPIMQGYDSVALKADVELGGTDQTFNILVGRELERVFGLEPQIAMMLPIIEGTDGTQKMSKSLGNAVGIHDPPDEMFGKIMSIPDSLMPKYFELLTEVPMPEIRRVAENPRESKAKLGETIVGFYHGAEAGKAARENFDRVFREKKAPSEIPEFVVPVDLLNDGRVALHKLLVSSGLAPSVREAKRLLIQGGIEVDGKCISEENAILQVESGMIVQAGKRRFVKLRKS